MASLLLLAIIAGLVLLVFGCILATDPEGRAGGWAALCIVIGIVLIFGSVIGFGVTAWHALHR